MATITKKDLVERIAEKSKVRRQDVKSICQDFLDHIIIELRKGNRLEFRDFGVFEVKERSARTAQNPKTMEKVKVPARRAVKFKVGRLMKEAVETASVPREVKQPETKPAAKAQPPLVVSSNGTAASVLGASR